MSKGKQDKSKTVADLLMSYEPITVPWEVWTFIGGKTLDVMGDQVATGDGDFKTLDQARVAIEWYVKQLNGTVSWDKK